MFCLTASGLGRAQAYQLLPLEEEEPEGEQIVPFQKNREVYYPSTGRWGTLRGKVAERVGGMPGCLGLWAITWGRTDCGQQHTFTTEIIDLITSP